VSSSDSRRCCEKPSSDQIKILRTISVHKSVCLCLMLALQTAVNERASGGCTRGGIGLRPRGVEEWLSTQEQCESERFREAPKAR
jgi:hypothetical protein